MTQEPVLASNSTSVKRTEEETEQYEALLATIQRRFAAIVDGKTSLFETNATGLFDAFLAALPEERQKHYTCNACRRFVDRFGGIVAIDDDGLAIPAMWGAIDVPPFFRASVAAMSKAVANAAIVGVFVSGEKTWGMPSNRSNVEPFEWHHMAVVPPPAMVFKPSALKTSGQRAAELVQEYEMLSRGLGEFTIDIIRQAHTLLSTGNLYRSEKCIGVAKWLLDLQERRATAKTAPRRNNIVWAAVATAPTGFCHVRSGMIGTLLEDVAAGMGFADIKQRFDAKMNPIQYQRPQVAPSAGNIAKAEKIVGELRSAGALERRFAKLEDLQCVWKPAPQIEQPSKGGIFGHLPTRDDKKAQPKTIAQPAVTMTWEKFARTVLPNAHNIELLVPQVGNFAAMVTATNPAATPILQWDNETVRNPVSWYLYSGGSTALAWNIKPATFCKVSGIAFQPSMWNADTMFGHQGKSLFVLLEGAKDTRHERGGGFFPETLRSEYREIRATMEAYAQAATIAGKDEATACGLKLEAGAKAPWNCTVRVTDKMGQQTTYMLDRWD